MTKMTRRTCRTKFYMCFGISILVMEFLTSEATAVTCGRTNLQLTTEGIAARRMGQCTPLSWRT